MGELVSFYVSDISMDKEKWINHGQAIIFLFKDPSFPGKRNQKNILYSSKQN